MYALLSSLRYWSAGLSADGNGARFLSFVLLVFIFTLTMSQMFRTVAFAMSDVTTAAPLAGVCIVLMVLFSGFIQPKSQISYGWEWFYWLNPVAWVLKAITVNQFASSRYDFPFCADAPACTRTEPEPASPLVVPEVCMGRR